MKFQVKILSEFEDDEAFLLWKELNDLDKKQMLPDNLRRLHGQLDATVQYLQHVNHFAGFEKK